MRLSALGPITVVCCVAGFAAGASPAGAAGPSTSLASADAAGSALIGGATDVTMTPDGRYVAFVTSAALDPNDTNTVRDVYRRDRRTGQVVRVSVPQPGLDAVEGSSSHPSISDDGNRVAFESLSEALAGADVNGGADVYVRDIAAGTTLRASVRLDGTVAGPASSPNVDDVMQPVISGDGRVVAWLGPDFAYTSSGSNAFHVFARRLDQPGSERVDGLPNGGPSNGQPTNAPPSISGDGRYIAFASGATNLVPNDTNAHNDIFVRDRTLQTTQRASVSSSGGEGTGGDADFPAISEDGSAVAFESFAPNLVTGDFNTHTDVFVRDLRFGQTSRASVFANGNEAPLGAINPAISATGRYVAFDTSTSLISSDTGANTDVYLADRDTGALQRASVLTDGGNALGNAGAPKAVGRTGRQVLFESLDVYVAGDNNAANDAYLRDNAINTSPVAQAAVSTTPGSLEIAVDGTGSSDPDGWVESYSWSFGDGTTAAGPRGPHVYGAPGSYSVVLTVTDGDGATTTAVASVDVAGPAPPAGPEPGAAPPPPPPAGPAALKAPRNLKRPAISADRKDRRLLRCSTGRWEGKPKLAVRWLRDGKPIRRATTRTHRIAKADAGHGLRCRVTATIAGRPPGVATSAVRAIPRQQRHRS